MFAKWPVLTRMPKTPIAKTAPAWWPQEAREICALADMPPDAARGFTLYGADATHEKLDLIIWRHGDALGGFVNQCPHMGLPLETFPDRFLSADGAALICSAHGARFTFDGRCFVGPCKGQKLHAVALNVRDGHIYMSGVKA
jgi:nitrite reductase/ring-hydroxylating ferredoxin subunit